MPATPDSDRSRLIAEDCNPGSALAFDYGTRLIGVAVGHRISAGARALTTLATDDWARLDALVAEWRPQYLVVCLPLALYLLLVGHWGWALRRPAEVIVSTMPWLTLAFVPLLFGMGHLYPWAQHPSGPVSEVLEHQRLYLNMPWIIIRAVLYFAMWNGCAFVLLRPDARAGHAQRAAAIGLILMFLTITFSAIDWLLAIEAKAP